jgi:hypothetical protein
MKAAIILLVLCGCANHYVVVPPTPEGNACVRQCMGVHSNAYVACLQTCPGAQYFTSDNPNWREECTHPPIPGTCARTGS